MSSVAVITPPAALVVSLEEAKAHLRVDYSDDDAMITALIEAAIQHVAGPEGWLGRSLVNQTLELRLHCFPACDIQLPCPPYVGTLSVKYDDSQGTEQTVAADQYRVVGQGIGIARLQTVYGVSWPSPRSQSEAVRIRWTAGYGAEGSDVPEPIRNAIKVHLTALHDNRAMTADEQRSYDALLAPYRVWL